MIDATNLTKSYGPIEALRGVTFYIAPGEIVGLLGPNGAGKTTIMKILTGYLQPDDGSAKVNGLDVLDHTREVQAQIGYLPENAPLYPELSVQAYLKMMAELRQIPEDEQLARLSEAIYATGLADHLTRPIGQLSKGFRQRVGLAQAILHRPRTLILDEPNAMVTLETDDKTITLSVGAKDPSDNNYVAISSESPYYVRVSEFSVKNLVENMRDDFLQVPPTPTPEGETSAS